MTDEEIREYAKNILLAACVSVGFLDLDKEQEYGQKIDFQNGIATVKLVESEAGEVFFQCDYNSVYGKSTNYYSPQPFIEGLVRKMDAQLNSKEFPDIPTELLREFWEMKLADIAKVLMSIVSNELWEASHVIPMLAIKLAEFLSSDDILHRSENKKLQAIDEILKYVNKPRKERILDLEKQQSETVSAPQYIFCDVYDFQLKMWKEAKACYKQNKKFTTALEMVKIAYPDLPEIFVERLALQGESEPAKIALDCTAWLLNVPDKIDSERSLQRYLQESRNQRKQISDDEAADAIENYFNFVEIKENWEEKINQIIKNSFGENEQS